MKFLRCAALSALILNCVSPLWGKSATNDFWFGGPEIFPIDQQIGNLHAADLTGDGLNDLIIADNLRSKIVLLYNETGHTNWATNATPSQPLDINQLPPGSRFRIDSIPVDERIGAMVVADLNGDGRPDIAFYGDSQNLEVIYNEGTNGWSDPKTWNITDGQMNPNALAAGDLTSDGRTDLVLLGDNGSLYYFQQKKDHTLADPVKIPESGTPSAVQIVDVNGDGRKDLLLVDWDSPTPFRVRLQDATGQLGPEIYFKTQPIRSYCADNLECNAKTYVVTIAQNSGRAAVSQFVEEPAERLSGSLERGQIQVLPLNKTDAAQRGILWTDVNGDGRPDLLVAQPDSGQVSVYLQQHDGSLAAPETFPTLAGVSQIAAADWNGNGKPDIFLLSQSEGAVGVAEFDKDGRLPFPTLLPIDGTPLVMAVGPLRPGTKPTLAIIVDKNGQRYLVTRNYQGKTRTQKLSASFTDMPTTMAIQDVNQDGLPDLVVLIPYDKIKVLLQKPDGSFDEENVDPPGGVMAQPWLASVDVDGKPELLLPGKNFVRAVVLEKETEALAPTNQPQWVFQVKDQINGAASDSQIAGACAVSNGMNQPPSIFLLDAEHQQLTLCQRDNMGVWRVVSNVPLPVGGFSGLQTVALGGANVQSVTFSGPNAVAWMPLAGEVWKLNELDGYDTPIKDGYLNDVTTGDLNDDGRKELVFLETARHYLDIVRFDSHHKLVPAVRWKVFEEHSFEGTMNALPEPREALVANVIGHKNKEKDLVVVVHDRILVYPHK
ncbi:MAG TPA: VCBS repeat-containing protein [Candidatus Saccharimonadales bacterium]|nr:VCBS repeat-containing protein [Candidatus Saccharimonadales bacterium]